MVSIDAAAAADGADADADIVAALRLPLLLLAGARTFPAVSVSGNIGSGGSLALRAS